MKLTQIEHLLTGYLALSRASKGKQALVFLMMETEAQKLEMCEFLSKNVNATEARIMDEAKKIAAVSQ